MSVNGHVLNVDVKNDQGMTYMSVSLFIRSHSDHLLSVLSSQ